MNIYLLSKDSTIRKVNIDLPNCPLTFIEGYEFTGKSYFMNACTNDYVVYEPGYHEDMTNRVVPYSDRYVIGISLIDLINKNVIPRVNYMINRGLISALVYNRIYNQGISNFDNEEFLEYACKYYSNPEYAHTIYICHESKDNAYYLYNQSVNYRNNESYDEFPDFDDYWRSYLAFNEVFSEFLPKICGKNYTILSSIDLNTLKSWRC